MEDKQSSRMENKTSEYFFKRHDFKNAMKDHTGCQYFYPVCSCCKSLTKIQELKENNRTSRSAKERLEEEKHTQKGALASRRGKSCCMKIYAVKKCHGFLAEIKEGLIGKT